MRVSQLRYTPVAGWSPVSSATAGRGAQLILVFGDGELLGDAGALAELGRRHPAARIIGCSTAGEISDTAVADGSLVATTLELDSGGVRAAFRELPGPEASGAVGEELARELSGAPDLVHLLVLSEGLHVNGSALVAGLQRGLPAGITVTGGLAGDGSRFARTRLLWDGEPRERGVAAVALCGPGLRVGCGSLGGWDPFGPERVITRAEANVLHELDGRSALELYKRYLGEHADGLPATGLLFPLAVRAHREDAAVVRTILAVDEQEQTMTFAGEMPQGGLARLMRANFDRLIDGAIDAAHICHSALDGEPAALALLVSCVGRRMVLQQRVEEELEAVRQVLGPAPVLAGFYSYGEISPFTPSARCELHNQTMTVTTLAERPAP